MSLRGPRSRRDWHTKGGNVIKGYRLEPAAAQSLTAYARENFCNPETQVCDIAAAARFILRTQLGWAASNATDPIRLGVPTRGMAVEQRLLDAVEKRRSHLGLPSFVGTVRHLLRLGVGIDEEESLRREARFAEIAAMRKEIMEAG